MSEELIVKHCSPTLAGLKTGSMFNCFYSSQTEMLQNIRKWNQLLVKKGMRIIPLRYKNNNALIYAYRPRRLSVDLQDDTASKLLKEKGYGAKTPERCILHLIKKLQDEEFPHEIGLFLGYPPEDVSGFIKNKAKQSKLVGCWKVYGDVETAQKLFAKYKKCTDVYEAKLAEGRSVELLTVAI